MEDRTVGLDQKTRNTSMGRPHVVILGAGASVAAFPDGDKNGRKLPVMNDLVEKLDLDSALEKGASNMRVEILNLSTASYTRLLEWRTSSILSMRGLRITSPN